MSIQKEILDQFVAFQKFLDGIKLEDLKEISRHDLMAFQKQLYEVKHRSLAFEIGKIIDEKKKEEFPQILGVHHYPELNEITYLSEQSKLGIDNLLRLIKVGNYISNLYRFVSDSTKIEMLEAFLVEKGIAEELYIIKCPYCTNGHLTKGISKEMFENFKEKIKSITNDDDEGEVETLSEYGNFEPFCIDCEDEVDIQVLKDDRRFVSSKVLKLIKKRDETYDNV